MRERASKTLELPWPLNGPWTPVVWDFTLPSGCALHAHNLLRPLYLKILDPPLYYFITS